SFAFSAISRATRFSPAAAAGLISALSTPNSTSALRLNAIVFSPSSTSLFPATYDVRWAEGIWTEDTRTDGMHSRRSLQARGRLMQGRRMYGRLMSAPPVRLPGRASPSGPVLQPRPIQVQDPYEAPPT